ncbi:L-lactate transporter [subsurface metagenome]
MVHIVPHATDLGTSAMIAANILAVVGGLSIVGRVGIGAISDRVGRKPSLIMGFALLAVALFWVMIAKEIWMLYIFAIIFGFSTGGLIALEPSVTAELFGMKAHGAILGTIVFGATTGGAFGSILAGYIFDITGSYYIAFLVSAVLTIASLILISLLKPTRREGLV